MIAHHSKDIHLRENENFSIWSPFIYIMAIIVVIIASIFIFMTVIRGIYGTQFKTFFITVPVIAIPIDRTYNLWAKPAQNIIIDKDVIYNNMSPLQKKPSKKTVSLIETVTDFNKEFYEQLVIWESKNPILKKEKFIFKYQGDVYFSSNVLFEKNSDILTKKGKKILDDVVHIFKNLTMRLEPNLKWDIQLGGFLNSLSVKTKISILRNIAVMNYLQKYIGTEKPIILYISSQKPQDFSEKILCDNNIGLKIIPAKDF